MSEIVQFNGKAIELRPIEVEESKRGQDAEAVWNEFWKELVTDENGNLDIEKVKCELADFSMLLHWVPRVYLHVTGGKVSKPNTWPSVVCSVHDDAVNDLVQEALDEAASDTVSEGENNG
jgi:hypothetical protein